jgi:hypothetical protein
MKVVRYTVFSNVAFKVPLVYYCTKKILNFGSNLESFVTSVPLSPVSFCCLINCFFKQKTFCQVSTALYYFLIGGPHAKHAGF